MTVFVDTLALLCLAAITYLVIITAVYVTNIYIKQLKDSDDDDFV